MILCLSTGKTNKKPQIALMIKDLFSFVNSAPGTGRAETLTLLKAWGKSALGAVVVE